MYSLLEGTMTEDEIQLVIEGAFSKHGSITERGGGMCGSVYFFDQGETVRPRYVVAKVPRSPSGDRDERNRRFLREIKIQHQTYYHRFVCWPFDYQMVHDTPVALFRAYDGDLAEWIPRPEFSPVSRLAVLVYLCSALRHCRLRGVECHQDLKPQNILMSKFVTELRDAAVSDVFEFPLLADFGLANAGRDFQNAEGARPYMAPEQWLDRIVTAESDIFSLGVIIFEVMTRGMHPYGGATHEWWPEPMEGRSRKWLRPETWEKWAKAGNPIVSASFLVDGVEEIARRCMSPVPADRPTLDDIQAKLLAALRAVDASAADQASFQACHADHGIEDGAWPYRDARLEAVSRAVAKVEAAHALLKRNDKAGGTSTI